MNDRITKKLFIILILGIITIDVGYAAIGSSSLTIKGQMGVSINQDIFISDFFLDESNNYEEIAFETNGTNIRIVSTLSELSSNATYKLQVKNLSGKTLFYNGTIMDNDFYSNNEVSINITGLNKGDRIDYGDTKNIILTISYKNGTTTIKDINFEAFIKLMFVSNTVTDEADLSNIVPGEKFTLTTKENYNHDTKTFYAEIDLSTIPETASSENLISIGTRITDFKPQSGGVNFHVYYPNSSKQVMFEPTIATSGFNYKFLFTPLSNHNEILKIAFNQNGLYVNGMLIFDSTTYSSKVTVQSGASLSLAQDYLVDFFNQWEVNELPVSIGSEEGVNRSNAKYKQVGFIENVLTPEEMIEITKINSITTDFKYTTIDTSNAVPGTNFTFGSYEFKPSRNTFYADIDLTNIESGRVNENLISFGSQIDEWKFSSNTNKVGLHLYYTSDTKKLILALPYSWSGSTKQFSYILTEKRIKIAFNKNGLYIDGELKFNSSSYASSLTDLNSGTNTSNYLISYFNMWENYEQLNDLLQVGSIEGVNKSTASYNDVRIYDKCLSNTELENLTQ